MSNRLTWRTGEVEVVYSPDLDGDGTSMSRQFIDYLKAQHDDRAPFENCFEWCAGPGFIGFALLAAGLCRRLVLADINARACAMARETVKANGLGDRVAVYEGDNLAALPDHERFDLVVSNPPNYYCLNPRHPYYAALKDDLRPNDPGWALHRAFYAGIPRFLSEGALLVIEEVDPFAEKCYLPNEQPDLPLWGPEPFDLRPRPPVEDFVDMIEGAGLSYLRTVVMPHPSLPVHLMVSRLDSTAGVRLREDVSLFERLGGEEGRYQVVAVKRDRVHDRLDLNEEQLWAVDLLERLVVHRGSPQAVAELARALEQPEDAVRGLLAVLRQRGWVHAPGVQA